MTARQTDIVELLLPIERDQLTLAEFLVSIFTIICIPTHCLWDRCYINIWSVAVPELDNHPDRIKGPDLPPCAGP